MNRTEVLRDSMLAGPHPKYGVLSYGRWMRIRALCSNVSEDETVIHNQVAWFVCTRHYQDPVLLSVLEQEDPVAAIVALCEDLIHVTEMKPFLDWFNAELNATDAATTKPKEDTGPGKPADDQPAASPTS